MLNTKNILNTMYINSNIFKVNHRKSALRIRALSKKYRSEYKNIKKEQKQ